MPNGRLPRRFFEAPRLDPRCRGDDTCRPGLSGYGSVSRRFLFHTLVVKISDTSYHGKRVRIPPLIDRAVESALRGLVRRGWRALREKTSAFRSGNLRNRLFPSNFHRPRGTRGPNLFSGGEEIGCIGNRKVGGSNPPGGARALP